MVRLEFDFVFGCILNSRITLQVATDYCLSSFGRLTVILDENYGLLPEEIKVCLESL